MTIGAMVARQLRLGRAVVATSLFAVAGLLPSCRERARLGREPAVPVSEHVARLLASPRIPDFSLAGYHSGRPLPLVEVVTDASRFGAKGDGVSDDTAALQAAIDATRDGALLLPKGRYVVTNTLTISRSHVVLRGAGPGDTVLVIPRSLAQVRAAPSDAENAFSYGGGFVEVQGKFEGEKLADVRRSALRGDRQLALSAPVPRRLGERLRVRMNVSTALARELLGGLTPGQQTAKDFVHYVDWASPVDRMDGTTLRLSRPLRVDVRPEWQAEIVADRPTVSEVGIEGLSFEFAGVPKRPHNEEEGFNAIFFHEVADSWVRDVTVVDADNGVFLAKCRNCQVERVRLRAEKRVGPSGHHALWVKESQDCLLTDFRIETVFEHDLSVEGFANGNVFMRGSAQALSLDHHRNAPYENLFTDLDAGSAARLWVSGGGEERGPHSGVRETLWNIRHRGSLPPLPGAMHYDQPVDGGWPQLNVIRVEGYPATTERDNVWIDPAPDVPPNLYELQRHASPR